MSYKMSSVYVSGYSCGLRNCGPRQMPKVMEWKQAAKSLDLCWTCACFLTEDCNLKYIGFYDQQVLSPTQLKSPICPGEGPKLGHESAGEDRDSTSSPDTASPTKSDGSNSLSDWENVVKVTEDPPGTWLISLLADEVFQQVACGWSLLAAISNKGQCLVWKDANFDRPFLPTDKSSSTEVRFISLGDLHSAVLDTAGKVHELFMEDSRYSLVPLVLPLPVTQVSCGKEHVVLLTERGTVYTYGLGSRGQLGHNMLDTEDQPRLVEALEGVAVKGIAAGGWHSAALDDTGSIYLWGWNESGQLGLPCNKLSRETDAQQVVTVQATPTLVDVCSPDKNVQHISLGSRHSAAVTEGGELWTWGWNGYGQLCHSDKLSRDKPSIVQYFVMQRLKVHDVKCRDWSTIIWASR